MFTRVLTDFTDPAPQGDPSELGTPITLLFGFANSLQFRHNPLFTRIVAARWLYARTRLVEVIVQSSV